MSFWWEDGYVKDAPPRDEKLQRQVSYDGKGKQFLSCEIEKTGVHHLDAAFFNREFSSFLTLDNVGRSNFSVSVYKIQNNAADASRKRIFLEKTITVEANSGFLAISNDDTMISLGVLKVDTINVIEIATEDLLFDMSGGKANGYWGAVNFIDQHNNNSFVELRCLKMQKSNPLNSVMRMWDLGCASEADDNDEDEVAKILWDYEITGKCYYCVSPTSIIIAAEERQTLEWLDRQTGKPTQNVALKEWVSKPVISSSNQVFAVAHIGRCTIRDVTSGAVVATVSSPEEKDIYPVVPVGFVDNDRYIICRIDLSMTLIVCEWCGASSTKIAISDVGSTISSNCMAISKDEQFLMCWPYGCVEIYCISALLLQLRGKANKVCKVNMLLLLHLIATKRAVAKIEDSDHHPHRHLCSKLAGLDTFLLRIVFSYL